MTTAASLPTRSNSPNVAVLGAASIGVLTSLTLQESCPDAFANELFDLEQKNTNRGTKQINQNLTVNILPN